MTHISAVPLGESLYASLRADIIMGRLAPRQKLRLENLRETYGAGLGSLREALARLGADGFVIAEGQKGFAVAPISRQGLLDIAQLRLLLETHALAKSFEAGDLAWEARVLAAHHTLDAHEARLERGDTSDIFAWRRSDWAFHQTLISACGSKVLRQIHAEVFDKYLRYQMVALAFRPTASRPEHRAMCEAALKRDITAMRELLALHIHAGVEQAISLGALE